MFWPECEIPTLPIEAYIAVQHCLVLSYAYKLIVNVMSSTLENPCVPGGVEIGILLLLELDLFA